MNRFWATPASWKPRWPMMALGMELKTSQDKLVADDGPSKHLAVQTGRRAEVLTLGHRKGIFHDLITSNFPRIFIHLEILFLPPWQHPAIHLPAQPPLTLPC